MLGTALGNHPNAARFGAIGPDMLFWADWNSYTPIVNTVFDVYHTLDEIYEKLNALWKPIGDAIDKVEDTLTGGLAHSIEDTVSLVGGIINTAMLDLITTELDYWQTLKPHFQSNAPKDPEKNWNWLDYTHHRATGQFNKRLIDRALASGDQSLQAYAYGWLSHVTADVVGHAYVNTAVGGPWRTHFQRHHLQENFMDVWTWGFYHTPGVSMPPTGSPIFDYNAFSNVNTANLHTLIDLGDDLPDTLQELIAATLNEVYKPIAHPTIIGFLGKEEINRAYQMQKTALEIITGKDRHLGAPRAPKVFGDLEPPTFPSSGGSSGGSGGGGGGGGGGFSLSNLLAAIAKFIKDTVTYLVDLANWLVSMITHALTYPIRYALYLLQLGLYAIYRAFRWALVVSAYVYPEPDQLADPFAQQFINPDPKLLSSAPRLEFPLERDHSQFYPLSAVEQLQVVPSPYGHQGANYPFWFIEGEPSSLEMEKALVEAKSPDVTAKITSELSANSLGDLSSDYRGSLGSAVDFYLRRAEEIQAAGGGASRLILPDWNIDADRGYGFKCWEALSKLDPQPANGVAVRYL